MSLLTEEMKQKAIKTRKELTGTMTFSFSLSPEELETKTNEELFLSVIELISNELAPDFGIEPEPEEAEERFLC